MALCNMSNAVFIALCDLRNVDVLSFIGFEQCGFGFFSMRNAVLVAIYDMSNEAFVALSDMRNADF